MGRRKNNAITKIVVGSIIFIIFAALILYLMFFYNDIAQNAPGDWINN